MLPINFARGMVAIITASKFVRLLAHPRSPSERAAALPLFCALFLQDSCNAYTLAVQAASFGASAFILYPSLELQPLESIDWLPPINPSRLALPVCVISASQAQTPTSLKPRTHTHARAPLWPSMALAAPFRSASHPRCLSPPSFARAASAIHRRVCSFSMPVLSIACNCPHCSPHTAVKVGRAEGCRFAQCTTRQCYKRQLWAVPSVRAAHSSRHSRCTRF